ncbi:SDR family oxidoreductase [Pontibacillus marinus]|uniref:3-ketoacyl-ACP reductase n=1 Tax=Pontibacillus marinus BH030004 = DSM 16465 TaxID=1385511 RepID=A0A0A5HPQ9_9BACI|nr:SDR family oxidoreductase [Pontibacillus marinus]KGX85607.1 3-ketoacyl-ACP reductase [Pontibacillus marinus BH030004 = DSM 16465]
MNKLDKKIALVTGVSHSEGIGAAVCRKLAKEGAHIFFLHWEAEENWTRAFQEEIRELGAECNHLEVDLSHADAVNDLLKSVTEQMGLPDIIVNNAAVSQNGGYEELSAKMLDDHYAVNMRSTFLLCTEFARQFKNSSKKKGRIINLTSGQALGPMMDELAYVATKGAISAFTQSLSAEIAHLGITVNAVNPGPTDSGWMNEEIRQHLLPKFKSGRIGVPEDAAKAIAFLASEDADWVTGQILNSEGGFLRD